MTSLVLRLVASNIMSMLLLLPLLSSSVYASIATTSHYFTGYHDKLEAFVTVHGSRENGNNFISNNNNHWKRNDKQLLRRRQQQQQCRLFSSNSDDSSSDTAAKRLLNLLPSTKRVHNRENQSIMNSAAIPVAGIHDALSARIFTQKCAQVLFISGFGISACRLGVPDAGILTRNEMEDATRSIVSAVIDSSNSLTTTPPFNPPPCVIVDGDTGYGGTANIRKTIRGIASIKGVSAITIEDQKFPKKCTYAAGDDINVVNRIESVNRIKTALRARDEAINIDGNDRILIIARTDCRLALGFNEVVERCKEYEALGADIVYAENLQSLEEYQILRNSLQSKTPMMLAQVQQTQQQPNGNNSNALPLLTFDEIGALGYDLALFGVSALQATIHALQTTADVFLNNDDSSTNSSISVTASVSKKKRKGGGIISSSELSLSPFNEVKQVVGFQQLDEFEKEFGSI